MSAAIVTLSDQGLRVAERLQRGARVALCKHRDSGAENQSRGWRPKAETPGTGNDAVRAPKGRADLLAPLSRERSEGPPFFNRPEVVNGTRERREPLCTLGEARLYVHASVKRRPRTDEAKAFDSVVVLTRTLFGRYQKLVYIAPCGVVVRAIAPCLRHKKIDPAVVVVDVGGRYAVSLLSGHEGGANALALEVANLIGAEPVISTTTEAVKSLIVGIGCRRGVEAEQVIAGIRQALRQVKKPLTQVRCLASAALKAHEAGLLRAAEQLGVGLRFIADEEIRSTKRQFQHSRFVAAKVNLPAVAEPAALLAGRRTQLILPKTIFNGVTVAIARESFLS